MRWRPQSRSRGIAIELAAWCHLRLGEVLGLERRDVDILRRRIHIERTAYSVGGKLQLGPPKTGARRRTVSTPPHLLPSVEGHLRLFVGSRAVSPLLTGPKGGRLGRQPLNAALRTARERLGRPEVHFHDLRGAGLTWAGTQGATTRELMARAGHACPAAALRYQHAAEDRDIAIADALSGLAERVRRASALDAPAEIRRDMKTRTHQPDSRPHPSWPGHLKRAADRDRTGMISLEG
jgi:integrase